jgi:hypothetical protein
MYDDVVGKDGVRWRRRSRCLPVSRCECDVDSARTRGLVACSTEVARESCPASSVAFTSAGVKRNGGAFRLFGRGPVCSAAPGSNACARLFHFVFLRLLR